MNQEERKIAEKRKIAIEIIREQMKIINATLEVMELRLQEEKLKLSDK